MSFPKITEKETIHLPKLDTLEKVREAELAFTDWIEGKFYTEPKPRDIYVYKECTKPAFEKLARENKLSSDIIQEYGNYLRETIINSSKSRYLINKNYKNLIEKLVFYLQISIVSWKMTGAENSAIRVCKIAGGDFEHKIKKALSSGVNFEENNEKI